MPFPPVCVVEVNACGVVVVDGVVGVVDVDGWAGVGCDAERITFRVAGRDTAALPDRMGVTTTWNCVLLIAVVTPRTSRVGVPRPSYGPSLAVSCVNVWPPGARRYQVYCLTERLDASTSK